MGHLHAKGLLAKQSVTRADHLQNAFTRVMCCPPHCGHLILAAAVLFVAATSPQDSEVQIYSMQILTSEVSTCGGIRLRNRWFQCPCFQQRSVIKLR
ncbi:hypothetical protein CY34DRAFT_508508 [Suillus luteus UH-Slu-Lm8-n1]|uniref:Uncharacterized protein n=1 Tax=Suillus luteus UH-Slu-Lm8-n1 TaxID=930992 RepID=A0A0D0AVB5_9AGAM|nr:hypothetical protein CY34DRAFT_508508 [Suillus luteus UH-Slu-Lm8-n1]